MNTQEEIILFGGGGHSKVLIEVIRMAGEYDIRGILDSELEEGSSIAGVRVMGDDALLPGLIANGMRNACIAVGSIKENTRRKNIYELVKNAGLKIPCLVHPGATVSKIDTNISEGVQIMAGAVIQAGCTIRENAIINTGAIVGHDCTIGSHVHICPGAVISGGCTIGDNSFIGAGVTVIQGIDIGRDTIIGAGSLVLENVTEGITVKGIPAR